MALEVPDSIQYTMQLKTPRPALLHSCRSQRRLLFSNIPTTASCTNRVFSKVTIKSKQEANLHVARKDYDRPCKKILQEDMILFSDPRVRLSVIGDSAMRSDSDRDPTLQSACVTLCKGLKPSQWLAED